MKEQGLNPQEVKELMDYIKENNSWQNLYNLRESGRKIIKYYTMHIDTRDNTVYSITLYNIINNNNVDKVTFRTEQEYDLKTQVYEWLNEISPKK